MYFSGISLGSSATNKVGAAQLMMKYLSSSSHRAVGNLDYLWHD